MKAIVSFLTLALLCLNIGNLLAEDQTQSKAIRAGVVVSLTGDAAMSGDAIRKGIELARAELQSNGWRVDLTWQDGETNSTKVISSFRHLSGQGLNLFIGPTWSFEINSAKYVLEQSKAVTIAPAGSSDVNGAASKAVFNLCPLRSRGTSVLTGWLKSQSYKKAYILVPSGDWGIVHKSVFLDGLKASGSQVAEVDEYDYGISPSALNSLFLRRKAAGADLILATGAGGDIANMLKVRRELHWDVTFVATEDLWDSIDMKLIATDAPDLKKAWVLGLPITGSFFGRFKKQYNEAPKVYADRGYDALMLLARAIETVGSKTEDVRKYLLGLHEFKGASGSIQFNQDGDRITGEYRVMPALNNNSRT